MTTPSEVLGRLADRLETFLASVGFSPSHRSQESAALVTRTYASSDLCLRLSSTHKTLALECDRLPNETAAGPWIDLTVAEFALDTADAAWISSCAADFELALKEHLELWE